MHLDWAVFNQDPGGTYPTYGRWLMAAWGSTISVALLAFALALILGIAIGLCRTLPEKSLGGWIGKVWVEGFRNVPVLLQVLLWYHVLPKFFPPLKQLPGFALVVIALGLFTSTRIAEQVRASLASLPANQRKAALALGLTPFQSYRYVLLPVAFRIILPPLTSEAMNVFKNSAVAFVVSVPELTMFAMQAQEETGRGIEIYLAVTLAYMASALVVNRLLAGVEKAVRIPGMQTKNPGGA